MRYSEILFETWTERQTPRVISKSTKIMSKNITARFTTDYGQTFEVLFTTGYYPQEQDRWEVHFKPINDASDQNKTANALSVFHNLAIIVQRFLDEKQPKVMTFGGEPKQFKILVHMVQDHSPSGYSVNISDNRITLHTSIK